ncbi:YdhR family protein [Phenylobacterium aquaticum]|uniref:YdhR family protein n=1 Tax=Phenylobacterium aquaticum TaxID=1763816 RepID=UPI001F5C98CE|nr:YdhR family protein [Phenylobacterium aquaticum]MCI3133230.1 YdhR family protein [Phenylobacterium aquaticum]
MLKALLSSVSILAAGLAAGTAHAQTGAHSTGRDLYAIVVDRDLPAIAPRALVIRRFKALAPDYRAIAGLRTKYFYITAQRTRGGIYLWDSRAAADAYLASPYFKDLAAQSKGRLDVWRFDIPVAINGPAAGSPALAEGKAVARIVRIRPPAGTPAAAIRAGFDQAVPAYEKTPGLIHKWFSIAEDGRFGGIYLFESAAAADAWFSPAWHDRVRKTYGVDGEVTAFDAPVVVEN